jgi:hypothetical protein
MSEQNKNCQKPKMVVKNSKWKRQGATSMFCLSYENASGIMINESDNLKTRNNYSLHMQEVVYARKQTKSDCR